jgi:hypothetical protein
MKLFRTIIFVILAAILVAGPGRPAEAHRNDESYLYLDVGDATLSGRVEMPYADMRSELGVKIEGSADELLAEFEVKLDMLQTYAEENTSIGADGVVWPIRFEGVELLSEKGSGPNGLGYVLLPFTVDLSQQSVPQVLEVTFTPFLEEIPGRDNITLVGNDWKRGVLEEETNELLLHNTGSPSGEIDLGDSSQWKNFRASIDLGVDHIRTGPDHVFFILVLLLPAVLVLVAGRWHPSPSFHYSFLRIVVVATMFTIAHSITFTLAGLDYLPLPPSKLTETVIALSIGLAALHNLRPIFGHREWLFAFVFGLFHGMGFAGLVEDLDINSTTQLVSLLGRNVGIEIAQLIIIVLTFPLLFLLRRTRIYMPGFIVVSVGLAMLSGIWMIERAFERNFKINGYVDATLEWPRALWVMLGLTALAAVYQAYERRAGRLLPAVARDSLRGVEPADETDQADQEDQQPNAEPVLQG